MTEEQKPKAKGRKAKVRKAKKPAKKRVLSPDTMENIARRRKARYHADPDYRQSVIERSRQTYRKRTGGVETFDPKEPLRHFDDYGSLREVVQPDGSMIRRWCFTRSDVAKVFGKTTKLITQWINDGRFPEPVVEAVDTSIRRDYSTVKNVVLPQRVAVYMPDEIKAALVALGKHLSKTAYYRKDNISAVRDVNNAVHGARRSLGLPIEPPENVRALIDRKKRTAEEGSSQ